MNNAIASDSVRNLLVALSIPRVGPAAVRRSLRTQMFGESDRSGANVLEALGHEQPPSVMAEAASAAEAILRRCAELEIWVISALDSSYPPLLRAIEDFPPVLFGKGNLAAVNTFAVAVVGTREASQLGLSYAGKIARALCEEAVTVVSGLALGIDTAAHQGALKAGGATVAVLAHGLDTVAPSANRALAVSIVASGGALVSEHPPGVRPYPPEFVRRNRIQSGISLASIMVESGEKGGSIHQAKFTRDQRRELYAVCPKFELGEQYGFRYGGATVVMHEFNAKAIESRDEIIALARKLRGNSAHAEA